VSEFHPIWCHIAQESRLEERGRFCDKIIFPDTSYRTKSEIPGHCPALPRTLSDLGFSARRSCTVLAIVCYIGVRLIPFFFRCVRNFERIISTLLVGVFITLSQCFGFGI
jgi:hypothetical protein